MYVDEDVSTCVNSYVRNRPPVMIGWMVVEGETGRSGNQFGSQLQTTCQVSLFGPVDRGSQTLGKGGPQEPP